MFENFYMALGESQLLSALPSPAFLPPGERMVYSFTAESTGEAPKTENTIMFLSRQRLEPQFPWLTDSRAGRLCYVGYRNYVVTLLKHFSLLTAVFSGKIRQNADAMGQIFPAHFHWCACNAWQYNCLAAKWLIWSLSVKLCSQICIKKMVAE